MINLKFPTHTHTEKWSSLWPQVFLILEPTLPACIFHQRVKIIIPLLMFPLLFVLFLFFLSPPFLLPTPLWITLSFPFLSSCPQLSTSKVPWDRQPEIWHSISPAGTAREMGLQRPWPYGEEVQGFQLTLELFPWFQSHLGGWSHLRVPFPLSRSSNVELALPSVSPCCRVTFTQLCLGASSGPRVILSASQKVKHCALEWRNWGSLYATLDSRSFASTGLSFSHVKWSFTTLSFQSPAFWVCSKHTHTLSGVSRLDVVYMMVRLGTAASHSQQQFHFLLPETQLRVFGLNKLICRYYHFLGLLTSEAAGVVPSASEWA